MHQQLLRIRLAGQALAVLFLTLGVMHGQLAASSEAEKKFLFDRLAAAESELEGRLAEEAIWRFWFDLSPTPEVRESLDAGIERREAYDFEAAEQHFDKVIELAPEYAEGYNQRAFIRFLRENFGEAESDLETVLKLTPDHFGAMAGMYQVMLRQDRQNVALKMLQQAVEIHPWIKERFGLPKSMWSKKYRDLHEPRQDI